MAKTLTAADRSALIRLAATLPVGSPERKVILAGCEKMKSPAMVQNCEDMKAGKKPSKGKGKSKSKGDDKMPADLLEKFKAKKKGKKKAARYPDYPYYVVDTKTGKVLSGWDYKEDAAEAIWDQKDSGQNVTGQKVYTERGVIRAFGQVSWTTPYRKASKRFAGHQLLGGKWYVDTAFINRCQQRVPGVSVNHMGFGEFYAETPKGRVDFDRMRGKKFEGQSGRSHQMYGDGADWLVKQVEKSGCSDRVASLVGCLR